MDISPELAALLHQQTQHQQQILTLLQQQIRLTSLLFTKVHDLEKVFIQLLQAEEMEDAYDD